MKRFTYLLVLFLFPGIINAQKNVVPVSKTELLNLQLPQGSKQDKRFISVTAASALIQLEAKNESTKVVSTEVYYLSPATSLGFNAESLTQALESAGYQLYGVADDDKFVWAENQNQKYLIYFSQNETQTELYIGACSGNSSSKPNNQISTQVNEVASNIVIPNHVPPLMGRKTSSIQPKTDLTEDLTFIYDLDGNRYNLIKIGENYWTKENLRTTQYNDTTFIASGLSDQEWKNTKHGAYAVYDNKKMNIEKNGLLYNGYAAASGKLCPVGWHVASDSEWNELEKYFGMYESELERTGERGNIADKLKNPDDWKTSTFSANNSSGFSIVPAGSRQDNGEYSTLGQYGNFWTSTVYDDRYGLLYLWNHHVHFNTNAVGRIYTVAQNGYSCRCVKDKPKKVNKK